MGMKRNISLLWNQEGDDSDGSKDDRVAKYWDRFKEMQI